MVNSVQGFDLGGVARKKKYNQDRTGQDRTGQQKSHKSVIFLIFGGKLPVKILLLKFGTGVDILEVVTSAEFDL